MKETLLFDRTARASLAAGMKPSEASNELRKHMILAALIENRGNICRAAKALNSHRNTISRQMNDLGIAEAAREIRATLPAKPARLQFSRRRSSQATTGFSSPAKNKAA